MVKCSESIHQQCVLNQSFLSLHTHKTVLCIEQMIRMDRFRAPVKAMVNSIFAILISTSSNMPQMMKEHYASLSRIILGISFSSDFSCFCVFITVYMNILLLF